MKNSSASKLVISGVARSNDFVDNLLDLFPKTVPKAFPLFPFGISYITRLFYFHFLLLGIRGLLILLKYIRNFF
jgi:hypothetical protein